MKDLYYHEKQDMELFMKVRQNVAPRILQEDPKYSRITILQPESKPNAD